MVWGEVLEEVGVGCGDEGGGEWVCGGVARRVGVVMMRDGVFESFGGDVSEESGGAGGGGEVEAGAELIDEECDGDIAALGAIDGDGELEAGALAIGEFAGAADEGPGVGEAGEGEEAHGGIGVVAEEIDGGGGAESDECGVEDAPVVSAELLRGGAEERGLAGAAGADDGDERAGGDGDGGVIGARIGVGAARWRG